jgi:3-hydroxyisobutyrate dehydrogenase-like beta-hydroxyacid dehydrogenase
MRVAFLGLGNMGSGIAQCILKAGFELAVWNRSPAKMQPLIELGAHGAPSARDAARGAEVVVSSLMDDRSVLDVAQGKTGLLAGMPRDAVHICVTTISPHCADELDSLHRHHGSSYVSGPVLGRPEAAHYGQLASFLAGDQRAIERVSRVCSAYSQQVTVIPGPPRAANCMKLALNYNLISIIELIGESYVFAEKCGLPLEPLRDFYQQLAFAHPALKMYAEKLRGRDFGGRGGFVMKGGLKDVRLMLSTADEVGAPLEIGRIVEPKLQAGVEAGMEESDWSAFYEITRRSAGLS